MSKNIEIEVKSLIDEKSYLSLIKGKEDKCYVQYNYYIDTPSFSLHEQKIGLRIRYKNNTYELTLKLRLNEGKLEINQDINERDFNSFRNDSVFPNGEVKTKLEELGFNVNQLRIFVLLKTTRLDVNYKTSLISIDKSEFNGITDYEVECEDSSMQSAKKNLIDYLKENEVPYQENFVSKLRRAKDSL